MSIKKAIAAGHICLDITPAFKSKEEKNIKDLFVTNDLLVIVQPMDNEQTDASRLKRKEKKTD